MFATIVLLLAAASAPTPALPASPPPASPPCTATLPADCLAGSWTGPFIGADWTFAFTRENGAWTGRYRTTKAPNWHPLVGLTVGPDGTATFSIESRPVITYKLRLDHGADTLSGDVDMGGTRTLPFAATRTA